MAILYSALMPCSLNCKELSLFKYSFFISQISYSLFLISKNFLSYSYLILKSSDYLCSYSCSLYSLLILSYLMLFSSQTKQRSYSCIFLQQSCSLSLIVSCSLELLSFRSLHSLFNLLMYSSHCTSCSSLDFSSDFNLLYYCLLRDTYFSLEFVYFQSRYRKIFSYIQYLLYLPVASQLASFCSFSLFYSWTSYQFWVFIYCYLSLIASLSLLIFNAWSCAYSFAQLSQYYSLLFFVLISSTNVWSLLLVQRCQLCALSIFFNLSYLSVISLLAAITFSFSFYKVLFSLSTSSCITWHLFFQSSSSLILSLALLTSSKKSYRYLSTFSFIVLNAASAFPSHYPIAFFRNKRCPSTSSLKS